MKLDRSSEQIGIVATIKSRKIVKCKKDRENNQWLVCRTDIDGSSHVRAARSFEHACLLMRIYVRIETRRRQRAFIEAVKEYRRSR